MIFVLLPWSDDKSKITTEVEGIKINWRNDPALTSRRDPS